MKILYLPNQYSQQRQRQKKVWIYPVRLCMEAEYYRRMGRDVIWDEKCNHPDRIITSPEGVPFETLPAPDRVFTRAKDKKYQSYGNYKYLPATHMMVADGCWHGQCTFCVENKKKYRIRKFNSVQDEIWTCWEQGYKEIFDDSGTFPDGEWMNTFCRMRLPKMVYGCNMRIGANVDYEQMKTAGFRMVLFGIESANQSTLDRINKGVNANDIIPTIKRAAAAGLEPHIAIMCGYPWENEVEENKTFELVHYLLRGGYAKTAQASVYDVQGEKKKTSNNIGKIYQAAFHWDFWINKSHDVRSLADLAYLAKGIKKGLMRD
jgi:radical SAM superfamily enzyme YgiQ (UPF0313 family)